MMPVTFALLRSVCVDGVRVFWIEVGYPCVFFLFVDTTWLVQAKSSRPALRVLYKSLLSHTTFFFSCAGNRAGRSRF